jgi:hypothetical protein
MINTSEKCNRMLQYVIPNDVFSTVYHAYMQSADKRNFT